MPDGGGLESPAGSGGGRLGVGTRVHALRGEWRSGTLHGGPAKTSQMRGRSVPGLHPFEADVWIWMCERKLDEDRARATKRRLLAQSPPPMFRQFLLDPP